MLRYLLLTIGLVLTINVIGQDKAHPVFVSTAQLELMEKESNEFSEYTKDLKLAQVNNDTKAISDAQSKMKGLLDKIVFRSQFIDPQLDAHMDLKKMKELKQEWVDGIGFKYYINLDRLRGTSGLTEIQMTTAQYQEYKKSVAELKALKASSDVKGEDLDLLVFSENLIKAGQLVNSGQSLLVQ